MLYVFCVKNDIVLICSKYYDININIIYLCFKTKDLLFIGECNMKKFVCILMVSIFVCSLAACINTSEYKVETQQSEPKPSVEVKQEVDGEENENTVSEVSGKPKVIYAEDDVVNRFISEFNEKTAYEMTDISKGNIRTKFFAYANDCYIEMINANDATAEYFSVSINGGKEISEKDKMFDVFAETIKVLDPSVTEEKVAEVVNYLKAEQYMVRNYVVSDKVTVETYVPIVELSYGKSDCRIDVISGDYK